jgi:hypothetical protein
MRTFRQVSARYAIALALTALLAGCLGNDAADNDPEANDPGVMNPDATEGDE